MGKNVYVCTKHDSNTSRHTVGLYSPKALHAGFYWLFFEKGSAEACSGTFFQQFFFPVESVQDSRSPFLKKKKRKEKKNPRLSGRCGTMWAGTGAKPNKTTRISNKNSLDDKEEIND